MQTQPTETQPTSQERKEYIGALGAKGGITLPAEVRRLLKVKPHDKVVFRVQDQKVEIAPATVMSLEEIAGSVPPLTSGMRIDEAIREAKEEKAEKLLINLQR
jgi:AbrB family looped-hinge helix DNA binding protein